MKIVFAILSFGLVSQVFGQTSKRDTTFLRKETVDGELQTIFIDNNKNNSFYSRILDFEFGPSFDKESYTNSLNYLKDKNQRLVRQTPIMEWNRWVTLKQYKQKFYAYHPCDFLFHFRQSFNDSTMIDWTGEGPVANKIVSAKRINNSTFEFQLRGLYCDNQKLTVHIVDNKRGIAVFEQECLASNEKQYYLMIAAEKIKSVPLIVNDCPAQKQSELEFETPDYKAMLNTKR